MFKEKKFDLPAIPAHAGQAGIPKLKGISEKNIEEHLKLYAGYVKNSNLVLQKIDGMLVDSENNAYVLGEVQRRFGFEYNGMRNHEVYFDSLSGSPTPLAESAPLQKQIEKDFGSFDGWLARFKAIAMTRGIGWAMLYWDRINNRFLNAWVDEHHLGQLNDCALILALDMWEHAFVADYQPSGKKQYVEDFFVNLNWSKVEENFKKVVM